MHLSLILDMAADALGDRPAVTAPDGSITYAELRERADALAGALVGERAVQLGLNSLAVPVTLFAAARAGAAFTPLNYRLADPDLVRIATRAAPATAVVDRDMVKRLDGVDGLTILETESLGDVAPADFVAGLRHRQHGDPALHVGHHGRAQGGGAAAPPRHVVRHGHPRVRRAPARRRRRS